MTSTTPDPILDPSVDRVTGVPPRIVTELFRLQDSEALYDCRLRDILGLRATDYAAVRYIAREESFGRTPRSQDLTRVLGITNAATTSLVNRLVTAGHLTRHPDPDDGRGRTVRLTPTTHEAFTAATSATWADIHHALTSLSDRDQTKIADLFAAVTVTLGRGAHTS